MVNSLAKSAGTCLLLALFVPWTSPAAAEVVFYIDEGMFDAAFPGLEVEDFEAGTPGLGLTECATPIAAGYPSPTGKCFAADTLQPRLMVASADSFQFSGLRLWPAEGSVPSQAVSVSMANPGIGLRLYFPGGARAVGFDIWGEMVGNFAVTVEVYGKGGSLLDSSPATGSVDGNFFGLSSSRDFHRIEIHSDTEIEGVDNVRFEADLIFRDGFESGDQSQWICGDYDGDGLTQCGGDCDDFDPLVPGELEICGDGRNNDCSGGVDDCCDPLDPECEIGKGCYPFLSTPQGYFPQSSCALVGEDQGQGAICQFVNSCRAGYGCVLLDLENQLNRLCAYLCDADDDVPGCQDAEGPGPAFVCARLDEFYSDVSSLESWGMCIPEDLTCDDDFCQPWEDSVSCPEDCP